MVEHDRVPASAAHSPAGSTTSLDSASEASSVQTHPSTPSQSSKSSRVTSQKSQRSGSAAATTPIVQAVVTVIEHGPNPPLRQEKRRISHRSEQGIPVSSTNPPTSITHISLTKLEDASAEPIVEEFVPSQPISNSLVEWQTSSDQPVKAYSGYIHTEHGIFSTVAMLDDALEYNFMSLAQALELRLEVEQLEDRFDTIYVKYRNGETWKTCGEVTIHWSEHLREQRPYTVRCLVCEQDIQSLMFGKPFLENRER